MNGAILVFLPGWDDISTLKEALTANGSPFSSGRYQVLPLHSQVAPAEQRKVFQTPPAGARKIVLSTNVAETAVTIEDVVFVINSGRMKEKSFDPYTSVSTLQSGFTSRASERQRRGRAGRCQPGLCFHLYSRHRAEQLPVRLAPDFLLFSSPGHGPLMVRSCRSVMTPKHEQGRTVQLARTINQAALPRVQEFQAPELKRTPLDELCLQAKLVAADTPLATFLARALDPPVPRAVDAAVSLLTDIGALDATERLTVLGRHLAALPMSPRLGKLVLYGLAFDCVDPILTIACAMSYRCACPPLLLADVPPAAVHAWLSSARRDCTTGVRASGMRCASVS